MSEPNIREVPRSVRWSRPEVAPVRVGDRVIREGDVIDDPHVAAGLAEIPGFEAVVATEAEPTPEPVAPSEAPADKAAGSGEE